MVVHAMGTMGMISPLLPGALLDRPSPPWSLRPRRGGPLIGLLAPIGLAAPQRGSLREPVSKCPQLPRVNQWQDRTNARHQASTPRRALLKSGSAPRRIADRELAVAVSVLLATL